ncbi:hypothetical protein [Amycolatopsis sp. CA-230715]|uniref:hypothetical protein n=1 Tax=Amycolatopsis sp. CA-230715 TaxID=2745196 RepID=UPI001C00B282|nr:hypothetical protein [Amycolatopsis sp. CA-230715]
MQTSRSLKVLAGLVVVLGIVVAGSFVFAGQTVVSETSAPGAAGDRAQNVLDVVVVRNDRLFGLAPSYDLRVGTGVIMSRSPLALCGEPVAVDEPTVSNSARTPDGGVVVTLGSGATRTFSATTVQASCG